MSLQHVYSKHANMACFRFVLHSTRMLDAYSCTIMQSQWAKIIQMKVLTVMMTKVLIKATKKWKQSLMRQRRWSLKKSQSLAKRCTVCLSQKNEQALSRPSSAEKRREGDKISSKKRTPSSSFSGAAGFKIKVQQEVRTNGRELQASFGERCQWWDT